MRYFAALLAFSSTLVRADVVLFDEPQAGPPYYYQVGQKKPSVLAASVIETCSYNHPDTGLACIEGTNTSNGNKFSIDLLNGWIDPTEFDYLIYRIRAKGKSALRMNIHSYGNLTSDIQIGNQVTVAIDSAHLYGLTGGNYVSYQTCVIPISAFNYPAGATVNRWTWDMVQASPGFYIDGIVLVGAGTIHYPSTYPPQ